MERGVAFGPNEDPDAISQLIEHVGDVDCVVVSHGSPMISAEVMDGAPNLKIIGELKEDRSAYRIDVESAWERGIRTVDTTHGSSYPVAERALGHVPTIRVCAWDRAFGTRHQRGGIRGMPACGVLRLHSLASQPPPPFISLEGCDHGIGYPRPM